MVIIKSTLMVESIPFCRKCENMKNNQHLLSIGQMSKLSGASIKSLRYYESIQLLIPSYIDPISKYRYYTYNQIYIVGIIIFCVELDIPLQELKQFIIDKNHIHYQGFLDYSKAQALDKIDKINKGLDFIRVLESQVDTKTDLLPNTLFTRKLPSIKVKTYPITSSLLDHFSIIELFIDHIYDYDHNSIPIYGLMSVKENNLLNHYAFIQTNHSNLTFKKEDYLCIQNNHSMIEDIQSYIDVSNKDYLAYEIEILKPSIDINQLTYELRVLIKEKT